MKRGILKSTLIISVGTLISKIFGFLRDIVIAYFFGTNQVAQAFVVAFKLPNLLRYVVGEGGVNSAVVPVLSEYAELKSKQEFWRLSRSLFFLSLIALIIISIAGSLSASWLVRIMAPGFLKNPEQFDLAVNFVKITFPYILFIGLTAFLIGILNSIKHFAIPAISPFIFSVVMMLSCFFLYPYLGGYCLPVGVLAGGLLQFGANFLVCFQKGFRLNRDFSFRHPDIKEIFKLLIPRIFGVGIYQLGVFVDSILASLEWIVGTGGIAALYYANRLLQFPMALVSVAIAQAALPTMSRFAAKDDLKSLKETLYFSLSIVFFVMVPATFGFLFFGKDIVKILFERGEFTQYSAQITGIALVFYAVGLCGVSGIKVIASVFFSLKDTATPVKAALLSLILGIVLALILMKPLKIGGLSLSTSIAGTVNFLILFLILHKKIGNLSHGKLLKNLFKLVVASVFMVIVAKVVSKNIYVLYKTLSFGKYINLTVILLTSFISFIVASIILKVEYSKEVIAWLLKKIR